MHNVGNFMIDQRRRGLMPSTLTAYRYQLSRLHRFHGGDLLTVDRETIERFLDSREPLEARSRYNYLSCFTAFYKWALHEDMIEASPVERIARPKLRRHMPRPVSDEELAMALGAADPMRRAWITLMAYAGMRCAEVAQCQRSDLFTAAGVWHLHILGKGGHERIVAAHPLVMAVFAQPWWARTGPMFRQDDRSPWLPGQVSRRIGDLHREIGIAGGAHRYRHWFGTNALVQAKGDLLVVQYLMGHASVTTTTIYTAFSKAGAADAVNGLPDVETSVDEEPDEPLAA